MNERCINFPCALPKSHAGPCRSDGHGIPYTTEDVEALLDIALKARDRMKPECSHPPEWRTKGICGTCLCVVDKREAGLYGKYHVERTDGQSAPGGKHDGCQYFVLDVTHDQHALEALKAYADSCEKEYPSLAQDLRVLAYGKLTT